MTATRTAATHLTKDEGLADLWWPYGPSVGRYTIKTTAEQTAGSLVQLVIRDSRGAATPVHIHHDADETFYVIEGEVTAFIGDERIDAKAGDFVLGPRGVPHAWAVTSEHAELLVTTGPGGAEGPLGSGIDGFFREVGYPVEGEKPEPQMPDAEHFAQRMIAHGIELVGPPPSL